MTDNSIAEASVFNKFPRIDPSLHGLDWGRFDSPIASFCRGRPNFSSAIVFFVLGGQIFNPAWGPFWSSRPLTTGCAKWGFSGMGPTSISSTQLLNASLLAPYPLIQFQPRWLPGCDDMQLYDASSSRLKFRIGGVLHKWWFIVTEKNCLSLLHWLPSHKAKPALSIHSIHCISWRTPMSEHTITQHTI
jgi:hypothetical protein